MPLNSLDSLNSGDATACGSALYVVAMQRQSGNENGETITRVRKYECESVFQPNVISALGISRPQQTPAFFPVVSDAPGGC